MNRAPLAGAFNSLYLKGRDGCRCGTQRGSAYSAPFSGARFQMISGNETLRQRSRQLRARATDIETKPWAQLRATISGRTLASRRQTNGVFSFLMDTIE